MNQDEEHLRLLSIFHYIVGGVAALFACFPFIHLVVGILVVNGALGNEGPPPIFGWLMIGIATIMIILGGTLAAAILVAARLLSQRTNYTYCLAVAAVECIFMPVGTVLGVFTIIVLNRSSVRALFNSQGRANGGSPLMNDPG